MNIFSLLLSTTLSQTEPLSYMMTIVTQDLIQLLLNRSFLNGSVIAIFFSRFNWGFSHKNIFPSSPPPPFPLATPYPKYSS